MRDSDALRVLVEIERDSQCLKRAVGAFVELGDGSIYQGSSAVPQGGQPCPEGGCARCASTFNFGHGRGYELCVCLHAEQAALATCALASRSPEGAVLYSSYQPCLSCLKEIVGYRIHEVRFRDPWVMPVDVSGSIDPAHHYASLTSLLPAGMRELSR